MPRMVLLSVSLHLALIMLIQPAPGQRGVMTPAIEARIVSKEAVAIPEAGLEAIEPIQEVASVAEAVPVESKVPVVPVEKAAEPVPMPPAATVSPTIAPALVAEPPVAASPMSAMPPIPAAPSMADALPTVPVMLDTNWYTARQLDQQPKARVSIKPEYPHQARLDGLSGTVTLVLRIDEFGIVRDAKVEQATPEGVFEESALAAFLQARFAPARIAGREVRAEIRIRVTYSLTD